MPTGDTRRPPPSLATKLDRLFQAVRPAGRSEYSYQEVADAIRGEGGPTISATYLWQLRKGIRDNPTRNHLAALARFFGVSPAYFFDDDAAEVVDAQLSLLAAMRDASVRSVALRAAGLSVESLAAVQVMIDHARRLEGLESNSSAAGPGAGSRGGRARWRPAPGCRAKWRPAPGGRVMESVRRRCEARLRHMPLPDPFDLAELCQTVSARRGRPLHGCQAVPGIALDPVRPGRPARPTRPADAAVPARHRDPGRVHGAVPCGVPGIEETVRAAAGRRALSAADEATVTAATRLELARRAELRGEVRALTGVPHPDKEFSSGTDLDSEVRLLRVVAAHWTTIRLAAESIERGSRAGQTAPSAPVPNRP